MIEYAFSVQLRGSVQQVPDGAQDTATHVLPKIDRTAKGIKTRSIAYRFALREARVNYRGLSGFDSASPSYPVFKPTTEGSSKGLTIPTKRMSPRDYDQHLMSLDLDFQIKISLWNHSYLTVNLQPAMLKLEHRVGSSASESISGKQPPWRMVITLSHLLILPAESTSSVRMMKC